MQSLFLKLTLMTSLLMQCGGTAVQRKEESKPVSSQVQTSANKASKDECDFSTYNPVRIIHFDPKAVTRRVEPEYPPEAAQRGVQGQVIVKALVNEKGVIERACAVEGEEALRRAAEQAALQWTLKPGYGLAFLRPKTKRNPKNYAEVYIVFTFKLDLSSPKGTTSTKP
jgi:TonB family protein